MKLKPYANDGWWIKKMETDFGRAKKGKTQVLANSTLKTGVQIFLQTPEMLKNWNHQHWGRKGKARNYKKGKQTGNVIEKQLDTPSVQPGNNPSPPRAAQEGSSPGCWTENWRMRQSLFLEQWDPHPSPLQLLEWQKPGLHSGGTYLPMKLPGCSSEYTEWPQRKDFRVLRWTLRNKTILLTCSNAAFGEGAIGI